MDALSTNPVHTNAMVDQLKKENAAEKISESQALYNILVVRLVAILKSGAEIGLWPWPRCLATKDQMHQLRVDFEVPTDLRRQPPRAPAQQESITMHLSELLLR